MSRERKFTLGQRSIAVGSILVLLITAIIVLYKGIGLMTGVAFAVSGAGLIGPCISSTHTVLEIASDVLQLVVESFLAVVEWVFDIVFSLFPS